jgi:hypothetical protein
MTSCNQDVENEMNKANWVVSAYKRPVIIFAMVFLILIGGLLVYFHYL